MSFSSINIQGNIISSEVLDKIRSEEKFKHQQAEAFGLARSASLRDEIGWAWSNLRNQWRTFKLRLDNLPKGKTEAAHTREKLIIPLLSELGYELNKVNAQQVNGKSYAISHAATNKDNFPVMMMGYTDHLDKRREVGGPRLSPHALVQEYLNNTEHLYALVTNGKQLRLLRDATRLVRMSYLEFDLERMFEEELYADFSLLYRVLHASRMPEQMEAGADSVIEFYHQESMASGSRIREKLSLAVEESIKTLANGFLLHRANEALIAKVTNGRLSADDYYMHQLRLIYRVLFLIVLEERKLVYPSELTEEEQRQRDIYYKYYSIERLRKLTEKRVYIDADKHDLWEGLKTTFMLFEDGKYGEKLGIKPLGSGLFAPEGIGMLKQLHLSNGHLIEVLKYLTTFVDENGQLTRVNYSDLDVEEFGSIYEGLLEYDPMVAKVGANWAFSFVKGDGRSSSGSHYTPEELVKPLIKHSLEYIIEDKLKEADPEAALLSITVCDVACGSGHILLSAARRIATELASHREGAEQPSPTYYRAAIRDVICHCIYGVDLNPLAVELCKVALWLEAHNPNEPLNFLDHHIKCGNAIVGLAHREELENGIASEAFKKLPEDDKDIAKLYRDQNNIERKARLAQEQQLQADFEKTTNDSVQEAMVEYKSFKNLPERTPEQIERKQKAYQKFLDNKGYNSLKALADTQVAQFFIPKTEENKDKLMLDAEFRRRVSGYEGWTGPKTSFATTLANKKRFFHWFLEFPEVFEKGGFDCILGNPPYLGGTRLITTYGQDFGKYLLSTFSDSVGKADLIVYFLRRIFSLQKKNGFQAIITTNSISQGKTRSSGLKVVTENGGQIVYAEPTIRWPGKAAVEVTLISIIHGCWDKRRYIGREEVFRINSYLSDTESLGEPYALVSNGKFAFIGSKPYSSGFTINESVAKSLLKKDSNNFKVIFRYLGGNDINENLFSLPSKWIINFKDYTRNFCKSNFQECYEIIYRRVKPDRDAIRIEKEKKGKKLDTDDIKRITKWWLYERNAEALYKQCKLLDKVLVVSKTTKHNALTYMDANLVFDQSVTILTKNNPSDFSIFQSTFLEVWAWKNSSTLGANTIRLNPSSVYYTFPQPSNKISILDSLGDKYYKRRVELAHKNLLALTKTYNSFHSKDVFLEITESELSDKNKKQIESQYGKEVWNLWNHLQKTEDACTWEEAVEGIVEIRRLHKEMDEAVLAAYGWHASSEKWGKAIDLRHDFYEVDYLPENDRVRYTIHPDARKEVLKRLLLLNHERYEEEIHQGLHKKKDVEKYYADKGLEVPEGIVFSDKKAKAYKQKKGGGTVSEGKAGYGQGALEL